MKSELKILLLEDIAEEGILIERAMKRERLSFVCKRVDSRPDYSKLLYEFQPDVVLADHALPQFNSIEALSLCRKYSGTIPFILVTGTVSEEFAVTCLKQGADDYVLKSNLSRLPAAIVNALNQREAEEKKKIAESELRIQNEELLRSNNQLVKTNMELDNFVYSVSHNLRAPLSSILGIVNVARIEDGSNTFSYLNMIEKSVQKLDQTIRDILDYSRNGRTEIIIDHIDLRELFFQHFEKLKYLPGVDQIEVSFNVKGHETCYSDSYRIGLIFTNLLANAIKYADPAKSNKYIKVTATVTDRLTIEFKDNGLGIKTDHLQKIFKMFFRGNEKSEGAGLGLYITREAVEKMFGKISVESTERVGTTFTVILPLYNDLDNHLSESKH
jgi:signal transduction histidine kinase